MIEVDRMYNLKQNDQLTLIKGKLQHASQIVKNSCLYISINAQNKSFNTISGKFKFEMMRKKMPGYVREDMTGRKLCFKRNPEIPTWFLMDMNGDSVHFHQNTEGTFELRLN